MGFEIIRIGLPLAGMRMITTIGAFPFLFVLGTIGTPVVAAYAIGQRIMNLATIPGFGYATSASALVGQSLGKGDESEATEYGWQTLRLALATELSIAAFFFIFATPVARLFGTEHVALTALFIQIFSITVAGSAIMNAFQGCLRAAGDTTWPFYGAALGTGIRLIIAFLALPASYILVSIAGVDVAPGMGLGIVAIFLALIVDQYTKAAIVTIRFLSGKWKIIARRSNEAMST